MKLDDYLNRASSAAMSQMLDSENIVKNMSVGLLDKVRNLRVGLVVGVLAFSSTGIAHADSTSRIFNSTVGIGALAGIMKSGEVPEGTPLDCAVSGKSGVAVTAGTLAGAFLGKHVGGGNGKKAAIILGGLAGGAGVSAMQDASIRNECMRQNAGYQQRILETSHRSSRINKVSPTEVYSNTPSAQYHRNGDFSIADSISGNPQNVNAVYSPNQKNNVTLASDTSATVFRNASGDVYNPNGSAHPAPVLAPVAQPFESHNPIVEPEIRYPQKVVANVPQNTVLYAFEDKGSRRVTYVTGKDSPGVSSMVGNVGNLDVGSHPKLQKKLDELNNQMLHSFDNLARASNDYLHVTNGVPIDSRTRLNRNINRNYVNDRVKNVEISQKEFSRARGHFMQLADVAALEGYSLTRYEKSIQFLDDGPLVNRLYQKKNVNGFTKFTR